LGCFAVIGIAGMGLFFTGNFDSGTIALNLLEKKL